LKIHSALIAVRKVQRNTHFYYNFTPTQFEKKKSEKSKKYLSEKYEKSEAWLCLVRISNNRNAYTMLVRMPIVRSFWQTTVSSGQVCILPMTLQFHYQQIMYMCTNTCAQE